MTCHHVITQQATAQASTSPTPPFLSLQFVSVTSDCTVVLLLSCSPSLSLLRQQKSQLCSVCHLEPSCSSGAHTHTHTHTHRHTHTLTRTPVSRHTHAHTHTHTHTHTHAHTHTRALYNSSLS